jgi:enoyl-CoA hydratase
VVDEFGMGLARSMLIAAEQVDATVAYSAGVVHRLGESGAIVQDAHVWAEEIAQLAPLSIRTHREMLRAATRRGATAVDTAALRDEVWASADADEGRAAFLEKRPARFTGR